MITRQTRTLVFTLLVAVVSLWLAGCASTPEVNIAAEEKAILSREADWQKAVAAKDVEKAVSFYADDAVLLEPNYPTAVGKSQIRASWTRMLAMPDLSLSWVATKVEVAKSGDLAYDYGTYSASFTGPRSRTVSDHGKYTTVWKKGADGIWRATADMINTDQPAQQPAAPAKAKAKAKRGRR